jgi:hypothetical protein
VDPRGPQRLVGVDVADAADDGLIEEYRLTAERFARTDPRSGVRERGSSGSRAMCDLRGDLRGIRPPSAGGAVGRRDELVDGERSERALIGEDDGELAVRGCAMSRRMRSCRSGSAPWTQQHLPAHPEVTDRLGRLSDRTRRGLERQPQELAAPRGRRHGPPFRARSNDAASPRGG